MAEWAKKGVRPKMKKKIKELAKNVKDVLSINDGKDAIGTNRIYIFGDMRTVLFSIVF